jgi:hypothetical protein
MASQRLPEDFEPRFGYRPWLLESFVDRARFLGTCYQAANWIRVGRTKGRGRQDRFRQATETAKDIYVYPLEKDFRAQLGLAADAGRSALGPADGLEKDTWAEKEFGGAPLGDARLSRRLVNVADAKANEPWRAFCGVAQGDWAAVKAYYRLIDMPEESAVTMANILRPHRERTVRRMKAQRTVLCVQDGSDLNYNDLAECEGLGALLVRAKYNRNLTEAPFKLFEAVRQAPVQSRVRVQIPRQSARPKKSKQPARPKRPGRTADLAVRYLRIQLRPAHYHADKAPIDLWVIHALEENPPPKTEAVEWFLLTTLDIGSCEDAEQCLRWYCLRWRIEDWHRVLKSGCRIENMAHENAERLRRAIAINLVIAWRIMLMTLLGREVPDLPAEVLFSDVELRTLRAYAKKKD